MANILVFGDSIGQGYYDKEGGWVDRLKRYFLQEEIINKWKKSVNVFNLSISGDTTKEILNRLENEIQPRNWSEHETIVIFAVGINDSIVFTNGENKTPVNIFKKNLDKLIKRAKKYSNNIIFISFTPIEQSKVDPMPWSLKEHVITQYVERYDKILRDFCKTNNLLYIYLYDKLTIQDLSDGLHPNDSGHKTIFEIVKNLLEEKKYI